jgi:hypothetical protein
MIKLCQKIILVLFIAIVSTSAFGQFLLSGSSTYSTGNFISPTTSGGTYVVGNYSCNFTVDTFRISTDTCIENIQNPLNFYVLKLDNQGNTLWLKSSNINDTISKYTIYGAFTDATDNLWVAGNFSDTLRIENQFVVSTGLSDVFVACFYPNGTLDTLLGNFAYNVSSAIYLSGFTSDLSDNALLYGAFKGSMKSSTDTIAHANSQLFLTKIDAAMQSEFLITKLDTPIISCDSSAIIALAGNGTKLKMAISVDNAKEYQIDTVITNITTPPYKDTTINLVSILVSENTFIAETDASNNFQYLLRTNYEQLAALVFDLTGNYYLLDNVLIGGDDNIQVDKYNSANILQWSHQTSNASSSITLKGKTLAVDPNGNVYYGGYFQATSSNRSFSIDGESLTANKDKIALAVKLDPSKNLVWAQTLGTTTTVDDEVSQNHDVLNQILALSETNVLATGYYGNELNIAGFQLINTDGINNLFVGNLDPYPDFIVEITPPISDEICNGDSVLLQASTGAGYTYQWTKDGNNLSEANTSSYYAKDSALYGLSIFNPTLNYTKKALPVSIKVNPIPKAEIGTEDDTVFCVGNGALLHAVNTSGYSYSWYNSNGAIAGATQNSYTAENTGVYHLLITSDKNCSNTSNAIHIEALSPTAEISNTGDLSICDGESIKLEALTSPDYKYQWYFEGDTLPNDTLTFLYAKISGAYQVQTTILGTCQSISDSANVSVIPSPPASISFSGDSVLCNGQQSTLSANTGFNLTYLWMLNNDTIPGETSSWISIDSAGIYRAIVGYEGSCSRWSNSKTLVVNPLPEAPLQVDGSTNICEGQQTLLSTSNLETNSYQWYRNNQMIAEADSNIFLVNETGTYFVEVSNGFGCSQNSVNQAVLVKVSPDATLFISGDSIFCEQESAIVFTYDQSGQAYQWLKNGVVLSNATSNALEIVASGTYAVQVTNVENQCMSESRSIDAQMIPAPDEVIQLSQSLPICDGDSVLLQVTEIENWSYQWLFNGFELYQDTLAKLMVKQAGAYSVNVINSNQCAAITDAVTVSLLDNPTPYINVNGLFLSTGMNGTLQWNRNGEAISGATSPLFLAEESGRYSVTAYYANSCFATSLEIPVCNPVPEITVDESFLTANEGLAYQWFFEGERIDGATEQEHRVQVSGNYQVAVTCEGGYTSMSDAVLVCIPVPKITQTAANVLEASAGNSYQWYKNDTVIVGADARVLVLQSAGFYKVWVEDLEGCSSFSQAVEVFYSGVEASVSDDFIQIFPNPAQQQITISKKGSDLPKNLTITITDLSGRKVFMQSLSLPGKQIQLSIDDLPQGIYLVKLSWKNAYCMKKIVKYSK